MCPWWLPIVREMLWLQLRSIKHPNYKIKEFLDTQQREATEDGLRCSKLESNSINKNVGGRCGFRHYDHCQSSKWIKELREYFGEW